MWVPLGAPQGPGTLYQIRWVAPMGAQAGRGRGLKVPRGIKGGITNKDKEQELSITPWAVGLASTCIKSPWDVMSQYMIISDTTVGSLNQTLWSCSPLKEGVL